MVLLLVMAPGWCYGSTSSYYMCVGVHIWSLMCVFVLGRCWCNITVYSSNLIYIQCWLTSWMQAYYEFILRVCLLVFTLLSISTQVLTQSVTSNRFDSLSFPRVRKLFVKTHEYCWTLLNIFFFVVLLKVPALAACLMQWLFHTTVTGFLAVA